VGTGRRRSTPSGDSRPIAAGTSTGSTTRSDAPGKTMCGRRVLYDSRVRRGLLRHSPRERSRGPQQRLMLEISWEAFERAPSTAFAARQPDRHLRGLCTTTYGSSLWSTDGVEGYSATNHGQRRLRPGGLRLGLEGPASRWTRRAIVAGRGAFRRAGAAQASGSWRSPGASGHAHRGPVRRVQPAARVSRRRPLQVVRAAADGTAWGEGPVMLLREALRATRNGHPVSPWSEAARSTRTARRTADRAERSFPAAGDQQALATR